MLWVGSWLSRSACGPSSSKCAAILPWWLVCCVYSSTATDLRYACWAVAHTTNLRCRASTELEKVCPMQGERGPADLDVVA